MEYDRMLVVYISSQQKKWLERHAVSRDITPEEICRELLDIAMADGIASYVPRKRIKGNDWL